MVEPLEGARAVDPKASTINAKKHRWQTPWEVLMEIQERPLSMLKNVNGGPVGGVRAGDPGAPIINARKHQRCAPDKVPEL
jgi:hypothetical protein